MPEFLRTLPDTFNPQSMIDLRNDKRTRNIVFFLRLFSVVFFVPLFAGVPLTFRYQAGFDPIYLWEFGLAGIPWLASFVLLGLAVYVVVVVHELLHAGALYAMGSRSVVFKIEGISPRSYDESTSLTRFGTLVYAATPFLVGSVVGVLFLLWVPDEYISWAFLPTVANGVISAADFVLVAWLMGVPRDGLCSVLVDGAVAYGPGPGPAGTRTQRKTRRHR
ncbi:MAG: metalloprotease family protein [Spirochaeta sp.]|jgi:hypothetical protein|nr:metalloprotease family protein [Spirochaeta sp.]